MNREPSTQKIFDPEEIGSRMSDDYVTVRRGISVPEAMKELIGQAETRDNVSTLYVINDDGTFAGAIDLKDLIIARSSHFLESILQTDYPHLRATEKTENCIDFIRESGEDSLPVLDEQDRLIGALTGAEIARILEEEMGEDYAKLGGLSEEEDQREPLSKSLQKRLPWLIVLFGLGLAVSSVVGMFEQVVAGLTLIVSFQSLILGMAGNAGTQSLAVTIRLLTDERLEGKEKWHLIAKEARVGFCNGAILGSISFVLIGLYLFLLKQESAGMSFSVSLCTGIALWISMLLSSISGTAIPIVLKKWNVDPAVASGPFITTINDLVAVVTYYGLAWILLLSVR